MIKEIWYIPLAHDENNENYAKSSIDTCFSSNSGEGCKWFCSISKLLILKISEGEGGRVE